MASSLSAVAAGAGPSLLGDRDVDYCDLAVDRRQLCIQGRTFLRQSVSRQTIGDGVGKTRIIAQGSRQFIARITHAGGGIDQRRDGGCDKASGGDLRRVGPARCRRRGGRAGEERGGQQGCPS